MGAPRLNPDILHEQKAWSLAENLSFYETHRREPKDLYDSERFFLPDLLPRVASVLDVGCAAGGFSRIMHSFNPALRYTGVDITPDLISSARKSFPGDRFEISDGLQFPFSPESFDLVYCSGVLHLNSRYQEMVQAMWRQTKNCLLCDFRLTHGPSETGRMDIGGSPLPYQVVNVDQLTVFLQKLDPRPKKIKAKGYRHPVSPSARLQSADVVMAFFLLEKGPSIKTEMELAFV